MKMYYTSDDYVTRWCKRCYDDFLPTEIHNVHLHHMFNDNKREEQSLTTQEN